MRLFDLHCDTLGTLTDSGCCLHENTAAVDMHRGGCYHRWTQAFAAWLKDDRSPEKSRCRCEQLLATAQQVALDTPELCLVTDAAGLDAEQPVCRGLLTVENGGALAPDYAYLQWLWQQGVRLVTLTWNGDNPWGSGCFGSGDGLTAAGVKALSQLEQLGIIPDVSHLGEAGFWQVAKRAHRPFVATHSNAAAVQPHPRNLTDDQFCAIRDVGGVVGINLYTEHLGGEDFTAVQRHLEHFLSLNGEKAVCFGADFDGMTCPAGWDGISVMEKIWQHLAGQGYPESLLDAVFYGNAYGFFSRALSANI